MPEGDSIHRIASVLGPLLVGVTVERGVMGGVERPELAGAPVEAVTAYGKHLTIGFARGWEIRVHLGMYGRWRRYRAPREAPASASLVLVTATDQFACLRARDVELTSRRDPRRGRAMRALGPDVLAEGFEPAVAAARARAAGATHVGVVLLDQRVAAGVGNVYKSEVLWLEQQDPFAPAGALSEARWTAIYARARELMRANLGPGPRRTVPGPRGGRRPAEQRYHVYGQAGRPCRRCGARIAAAVQGEQLRRTYYCPRCQAAEP